MLLAKVAEVDLAPAKPAGSRLPDGSPVPFACDQLEAAWCREHPDHHVYWVRHHTRLDGTLCVVMETSRLQHPLDGCPEAPTLDRDHLT